MANNIVLIDNAGADIFKKVKDGSKARLHDGGVYTGDRRLIHGVERTDEKSPTPCMTPRPDWWLIWRRSRATRLNSSAARARC